MRRRQDDLVAWADDPVVQALQAPATVEELSGQDDVMAAFRAGSPSRRRRPTLGHLGAGMTTVVVALGLSGGVAAAAYTKTLPAPVQSAMHAVFGAVGVPAAPEPIAPGRTQHVQAAKATAHGNTGGGHLIGAPPASPVPSAYAAPPAAPGHHPAPAATTSPSPAATAAPAAAATPTAAPQPSPTPTPTATLTPVPANLAANAARTRVPVGQRAVLHGVLTTADGAAVAGYRVLLLAKPAGSDTWVKVAQARTADDGTVTLRTAPLTRNVALKLGTGHGVHSSVVSIVALPHVTVSQALTKDAAHYVITVTVAGAQTGDAVSLAHWQDGGWRVVRRKQLDDSMQLTFTVPAPASGKAHYRVRLPATAIHGQRDVFLTLTAPSTSPTG